MSKSTRSNLNLQALHISDLLYYSPSRVHRGLHSSQEKASTNSLFQPDSSTTMAKSQFTVESDEENKTSDRIADLESKSNLQLLREQEKIALQSIKKLTEEEMIHIEQWLFTLHKTYEDLEYPSSHRVFQATTYFNDEQQLWYEQKKAEINNDWLCFCDRLTLSSRMLLFGNIELIFLAGLICTHNI